MLTIDSTIQRRAYARKYLKNVLSTDITECPDQTLLGDWYEPLECLYGINQQYGHKAAYHQWCNHFADLHPQLASLLSSPLYHVNEMDNLPPAKWLLDNEIPAYGLTVLYGPSGSGKSFIALDYALRIAQDYTVVYIAAEGQAGFTDRKNAWIKHHNKGGGNLYFYLDAVPLMDFDSEAVGAFRSDVEDYIYAETGVYPDFIVVDTLARTMIGGDENSAKDMGLFTDTLARIEKETGAAIMVVHHTGKSASNGPRGSSALFASADMIIQVNNADGQIRLSCEKSKETEPFEAQRLRLIPVELDDNRTSCVLVATSAVINIPGQKLTENQYAVLEMLNMNTFVDSGAKVAQIKQFVELSESTVYRILSTLMELGYLTKAGKYDPWKITEDGQAVLSPNQ